MGEMESTTQSSYIFAGHQDEAEWQRLRQIEAVFDPRSSERLTKLGLGKGHRCLEIGFGAAGILKWMLSQVGPTGHVTGVDINTAFLQTLSAPNLAIQNTNIVDLELAASSIDFVHARYVMVFIPEVRAALKKLKTALKPGGKILLEEVDFSCAEPTEPSSAGAQAFLKLREAIRVMFQSNHTDYAFGHQVSALLSDTGFQNLATEHYAPAVPGGSAISEIMKLSSLKLRDTYVQSGSITNSEFDAYLDFCNDPTQTAIHYSTVSTSAEK